MILKNGNYFLVQSYSKRRIDENTVIPEIIAKGILLNKNSYFNSTFGITGKTTSTSLNMKTASIPQIVNFMFKDWSNLPVILFIWDKVKLVEEILWVIPPAS